MQDIPKDDSASLSGRGDRPIARKPWQAPVVTRLDGRSARSGFGPTSDGTQKSNATSVS